MLRVGTSELVEGKGQKRERKGRHEAYRALFKVWKERRVHLGEWSGRLEVVEALDDRLFQPQWERMTLSIADS